ncbi:MAG: hypothetical protein WCF88_09700 [Candidatus Acidiferrales bacterium]
MSDLHEMKLAPSSLPGETLRVAAFAEYGLQRRGRGLAGAGVASGLLMVALSAGAFAPIAFCQGQTGAATQAQNSSTANSSTNSSGKPQAGAATQTAATASDPAQKPAEGAAQNEPKMEDQSAPAAESLGEAARRARAQKTQAAKPKVYTDDSVTTLSGHGVSVVGDGSGGGGGTSYSGNVESGGSSGGGGAQGASGSQESYWRGRANDIRKQMAACDQKISEIQDEIAKHGAVTVDPMSGAQAGVIFVEDRNAQIKQVEKQKEGFERQLEELAEEGRKAGADSGWFR